MAEFNDTDFISTPSGVKLSSNFLMFNSIMVSEMYNNESESVAIIIHNILANRTVDKNIKKYLIRLKSIDVGDDGYLLTNKGKSKIKFGKFVKKINMMFIASKLVNEAIVPKNIEKLVDFYKSWNIINKGQDLKFIEYVGDDIKKGYNSCNYYKNDDNMLANSCMTDRIGSLKIYQQNPDKVSVLALVDNNDKIHGRALLWQLDSGETYLDRVYTIDNFITAVFQDHAMKNEWIIRTQTNSYDAVSICRIDKSTNKYELLGESESKMKIKLNIKNILDFPYMDTFFIMSRWGNTFRSYSKKTMRYYKYQSTIGGRKKHINLFGLKF
jgi:uncharacterized protein (UPF0147 family)